MKCWLLVVGSALMIGCTPKVASTNPPALPSVENAPKTAATVAAPPASTSPLDEAAVPLYPGAKQVSLKIGKTTDSGNHTIAAVYSTPDSTEKVAKFYQDKLGTQSATPNNNTMIQIVGKTPNGGFLQLLASADGKTTKLQYYAITPPRTQEVPEHKSASLPSPYSLPAMPAPAPRASGTPLDEVAVPLYPRATKVSLKVDIADDGGHKIKAEYSSKDSVDNVLNFYRYRFHMLSWTPKGNARQLVGRTSNGGYLWIYVSPNASLTRIQYSASTAPSSARY